MGRKKRLKAALGRPRKVRVTLNIGNGSEYYHGFVVGLSESLLVLHVLDDFHLDGHCVVRVRDITRVRMGERDQTMSRILKSLGVHRSIELPSWLKYGSWRGLFRSLAKAEKCVMVERAGRHPRVSVGEILRAGNSRVSIRAFDASARWIAFPRKVRYKQARVVWFDDEYGTTFHEFMRGLDTRSPL